MPVDLVRPTFYRAPINLYVEDRTTLVYLKELWLDPAIAYFLGAGNDGVAAIIRVDQEAGHLNVFGVIDRDYGPSNRTRWERPETRLFRLDSHEVENLMLDAPALKNSRWSNVGHSVGQIEALLIEAAERRCWYEACRSVLGTIRRRFRENFINDPPQDLPDLEAAKRHFCESDWFRDLATNTAQTTEADIAGLLETAHDQATIQLADGTWRQEFSGKEIFKDVASRICDRQKFGGIRSSKLHGDLAEDVAGWQSKTGQVPPELESLHATLRGRVGLI